MIKVELADRIKELPPYLFVRLDEMKSQAVANGVDVIDLGIGDPDQPTPLHIRRALKKAADDPANHRYPSSYGMKRFREAAAGWMERRFQVGGIAPEQVVALIGSKEGLAHFPLAYLNPGDIALVPGPAYPVYRIATRLAGGEVYPVPLLPEKRFLPDLEAVPKTLLRRAKLLFLNYPNNPTGATAELEFFERVVAFALKYNLIVIHDAAYREIAFDGFQPPSILQVPGALDCAIEFHSLSKSFNMTGWRIGFATGCPELVAGLGKVKSNIDSGQFQAVQWAAVEALEKGDKDIKALRALYQARRDILLQGLDHLKLDYQKPRGSFYVWAKTPAGLRSEEFVARLLSETGIMTAPGTGYGPEGEGYFRMALIVPEERMREAVKRLQRFTVERPAADAPPESRVEPAPAD
jgi:LL-diaminopimelate aminotransferase